MLFFSCKQKAPEIEWEKSFGGSQRDDAISMKQTTDGGYIIAGNGGSLDGDETGNHGFSDFWIVKIDRSGNLQWQKAYGGSYYDEPSDIVQTSDNGYIVVGDTYSSNGDVKGHHQRADAWIVKLDSLGHLTWQKQIGGKDNDFAHVVLQTPDHGFLIGGVSDSKDSMFSANHGGQDAWLFKLDSVGDFQWQKLIGGSGDESCNEILETKDGGYVLTGSMIPRDRDMKGKGGHHDYWIVKLNTPGNIQWQKNYGGDGDDNANRIIQTKDGGYIVSGESSSNNGDVNGNHGLYDYWIIKLNEQGNIEWQKCYGGSLEDHAADIVQTKDGGYVVAGYSTSVDDDVSDNHGLEDFWIIKLSDTGHLLWERSLGGSDNDRAWSILQPKDGSYVIAGESKSKDGDVTQAHGDNDYWIVKLKPDQ